MAPDGQAFNFGARPRKLGTSKQKPDAKNERQAIGVFTNATTQITSSKQPSRKKSLVGLKKLSIFNLRKQKSPSVVPQISLSDGKINPTSAPIKRPPTGVLSILPKLDYSDSNTAVIDSDTKDSYFPIPPDKQVIRGPVPLAKLIRRERTSIESISSSASQPYFSATTSKSASPFPQDIDGSVPGPFDLVLVARKGPPSPANSFIESRSQRPKDGERIMEIWDDEDVLEVPTTMPPSPPMSPNYSYSSFPESSRTTEDVNLEEVTTANIAISPKLRDVNVPRVDPEFSSTLPSMEKDPEIGLSAVKLGKRPEGVYGLDSSWQPLVRQKAMRDGRFDGPLVSLQQASKRSNGLPDSKSEISSISGPSTSRTRPEYGILAGLQEMAAQERVLADELRQIEEEDRKLAEELQRMEEEDGLLWIPTEEDQLEWERVLLIEDEDEVLRRERLEQISREDALLAKAMMEQEQADLEAERREQERLEQEAREKEERNKRLAEERRIIFASREIGSPVAIRRVQNNGLLIDLDLKELNADIIQQLKNVRVTFSTYLPALRVAKVEWIINEKLRGEFENCREQLQRHGRSTNEVLLWHGTQAGNINSIITGGFRVGGVGGHPVAHGSSMGLGIYSSTEAAMPVNSYNVANRIVIAFRALPGTVAYQAQYTIPQAIGVDMYDSHLSGTVYVIRRPCQTLPCFLVHY